MDARQRERAAHQAIGDVAPLGGRRLEELAPRGHRREQVGDLDAGALRRAHRARVPDLAGLDAQLEALGRAAGPRPQPQLGDRGDRGQRLAAEAVGADPLQVLEVGDLAGGVTLEREARVGRAHAAAVVRDGDEIATAVAHLDADPRGAGVERVLDQLLHHRGRALDHLAGGDLIDQRTRQQADPLARGRSRGVGFCHTPPCGPSTMRSGASVNRGPAWGGWDPQFH